MSAKLRSPLPVIRERVSVSSKTTRFGARNHTHPDPLPEYREREINTRRHNRVQTALGLLSILLCLIVQSAQAATPEQVDASLSKAKARLYELMRNGNWEQNQNRDAAGPKEFVTAGQWGGTTAVAVYALLASGEDAQNPKLASAIAWLKTADLVGTYAISMRCQVWLKLPHTPETRKLMMADRDRLEGAYNNTGNGQYLYGYLDDKRTVDLTDHSVSQYGVLSMWACAQMGIEVRTRYWADTEKRWTFDQQSDGGWFYTSGPIGGMHQEEQASMTAAGVATLYITQDYVHQADGIRCIGNVKNEHIDRGLQWLAGHTDQWAPMDNLFGAFYPGYTLYGIERIGAASGLKYIGTVDWYKLGSDWCVQNQHPDGGWNNVPDTALCMLFLARGRAPTLINKVQYDNASGPDARQPGAWNQRPRDVANFVRWMSAQTEREANWQITNLNVSTEELHDAPFLYFAGNKPLLLGSEQTEKIKKYIQQGGMVLFNSDCGDGMANPFVASIIKLGHELFPDYEFRDLPESHPIFTNEQYASTKWKHKLTMKGLSNGVRELMVLLPTDPAKAWQLQETGGAGREECYQAVADLVLYGTDKASLSFKGRSFLVKPDPKIQTNKSATVLRLKYNGNWDPEPGGWERLAAVMHNQSKVDLKTQTFELTDKPLPACTLAHLTGTIPAALSPAQEQSLKDFVQHGGTLVVDSAGGSPDFDRAMRATLDKLFPAGLKDLPATDPIYTVIQPKGEVRFRPFARSILGTARSGQIKSIEINGRNAVYYSRYDLSAGLVGEPVDGIIGYAPDTATNIMSGLILRSLTGK